jgi:exodeoxyribonuclease VII large subunit
MRHHLGQKRQWAESRFAELNHLSPLAVLGRGYSIVQSLPEHRVVRDAREVSAGDDVLARLAKGALLCVVEQVMEEADFKSGSDTL